MKDFEQHFWILQKKLKEGTPFAFVRYSDGEMDILQNKHLVLDDKSTRLDGKVAGQVYHKTDFKEFKPEEHKPFRDKLIEAYKFQKENYYVGLSCPCCVGRENSDWMKDMRGQDDEYLTWANLLVNSNYPLFLQHMYPLLKKRKVVIICNKEAKLNSLPFKPIKDYRIGQNAMINNIGLIEEISEWIEENNINDTVFLSSASTLSNILIYESYKKYDTNTFIDIGTTLHPFMSLPIQRNYLRGYWLNSGNTEIKKRCVWKL